MLTEAELQAVFDAACQAQEETLRAYHALTLTRAIALRRLRYVQRKKKGQQEKSHA